MSLLLALLIPMAHITRDLTLTPPALTPVGAPDTAALPVTVWLRKKWPDPWNKLVIQDNEGNLHSLDDLHVDYVHWRCSPSLPSAQLSYPFGSKLTLATSGILFYLPIDAINLDGWYVRIQIGTVDLSVPGSPREWVGIIDLEAKNLTGVPDETPSGRQLLIAYGLEYLLDQHTVANSLWHGETKGTVDSVRVVDRGITFNREGTKNRSPQRHFSQQIAATYHLAQRGLDESQYFFSEGIVEEEIAFGDENPQQTQTVSKTTSVHWTTRRIVEHLIAFQYPQTTLAANDVLFGIGTSIAALPEWDAPILETHGQTTRQLLNQLVARQRLYVWWLEYNENANRMDFKFETLVSAPLTIPDTIKARLGTPVSPPLMLPDTIPEVFNQLRLDVSQDPGSDITIKSDNTNVVDAVVAQGARVRYCFTVSHNERPEDLVASSMTFDKYWTDLEQTEYETGAADTTEYNAHAPTERSKRRLIIDRFRENRDDLQNVYTKFGLSRNSNPQGGFPPGIPYQTYFPDIRILPTIPLLEGVDYSAETLPSEESEKPPLYGIRERRPLTLIKFPAGSPITAADAFIRGESLGRTNAEVKLAKDGTRYDYSTHFIPAPDGPAWYIKGTGDKRHIIGKGTFTGLPEESGSKDVATYDWRDFLFTIAIEGDAHAAGLFPSFTVETGRPQRVLYIDAGSDYRLDIVAPGTVVDLDTDLTTIWTTNGGIIRDDRNTLESIAFLAYWFYSLPRRSIQLVTDYQLGGAPLGLPALELGTMVTSVSHARSIFGMQPTFPVNSLITSVRVDFPRSESSSPSPVAGRPQLTVETDFPQFDPIGFFAFLAQKPSKTPALNRTPSRNRLFADRPIGTAFRQPSRSRFFSDRPGQ